MKYMIKELRKMTGLTQKGFSEQYGIPLSTLRKWEQGEASPAPYVLELLGRTIPAVDAGLERIQGNNGTVFYYDKIRKQVSDARGNRIQIQEDLTGVKEQNLRLYLQDLFEGFYEIQEKFNRDCRFDKTEDIIWS